jgi:predicted nucleic acid-binding protein
VGRDLRLQGRTLEKVSLFVDTSVWSLAFRRDAPPASPEVARLVEALQSGEVIVATGLVLQELLQGFLGPRNASDILQRFRSVPLLAPDRQDHIEAADLRNRCRRAGVQVGTIDALFAELCIRHRLTMLSADADFRRVAELTPLEVWRA